MSLTWMPIITHQRCAKQHNSQSSDGNGKIPSSFLSWMSVYHNLLWLQAWNMAWNMNKRASAFFVESQHTGLIYFKHKPRSNTDQIPPTSMVAEIEVMAQRL